MGKSNPRPLFIVGVARGGTNLVARALGAHRAVALGMDPMMPLFRFWRNAMMRDAAPLLSHPRSPDEPFQDFYFQADGPAMLRAMHGGHADYRISASELAVIRPALAARAGLESADLAKHLSEVTGSSIQSLLHACLTAVARDAEGSGKTDLAWTGAKEVWTVDFIPALARAFPSARFVVVVRDPRAVVVSLLGMGAKDPTQLAHVTSYLRHWRKLVALTASYLTSEELRLRLIVSRFETLCLKPEAEAKRLAAFLDIEFSDAMLTPGRETGWQGNSSFGQTGAGIAPDAADGWRARIDPADTSLVEFLCAPEMAAANYEASGTMVEPTDAILTRMLEFHNNPGSWRSDSGDPFADFAWELLRLKIWQGLASATDRDELKERCFLNPAIITGQRVAA